MLNYLKLSTVVATTFVLGMRGSSPNHVPVVSMNDFDGATWESHSLAGNQGLSVHTEARSFIAIDPPSLCPNSTARSTSVVE